MNDVLGVQPLSTPLYFDRGIDTVVEAWEPVADYLPDRGDIAPSELPTTGELAALLYAPNLDTGLYAWARPEVDCENLTPPRFLELLSSAGQGLHERALTEANPKIASAIRGGVLVLKENEQLNGQVWDGRHALVGG